MDTLRLDGNFPPVTREEWRKSVDAVLKGADFNKVLVSLTYSDIAIQPLYQRVLNVTPEGRNAGAAPWRIDQRIELPGISDANAQMRDDANGGANGFVIATKGAPGARGFGLTLETAADIAKLFDGLDTDLLSLRLESGADTPRIANLLLEAIGQKKIAAHHLALDLGYDPVGASAASGNKVAENFHLAQAFKEANVKARIFLADGRPYHEAGASEAQELAAVIATALHYMRGLEKNGMALEAARDSLSFLLVADADELMTVAKFRALRRLWRKIEIACGLDPKPIQLQGETAWRMMSRYDCWTNLLRATTAVFSAGIGGADSVAVLPFTNAIGLPDAQARRIARNIQLVLIHESNLWRVVDPAAGAGGFEELTKALCEQAWTAFQQIEGEDGITASLGKGLLQGRIAETAAKRRQDIAVKKLKLTGISEFPDIHGEKVSVLAPAAAKAQPGKTDITPLVAHRDAEDFEALRDRVESKVEKTGQREKVFIAAIGSQAAYTGRATFARNFFEVAGFETVMPDENLTTDNLAKVFARSGAKLVCIASSDDGYAEGAGVISRAFDGTDCRKLYLVCSKGLDPSWEVAGTVEAVTPRSNALTVLGQAVDIALNQTKA